MAVDLPGDSERERTIMTEQPQMLSIAVRGGPHDGNVFELPADQVGAGDTFGYQEGQYRLVRVSGEGWIARPVEG